ncbi:TIGR03118 family protein [Streptomyces bluensis]|uniref:TIGR03118 family protein n=1 Tax=Streptomyces bluensis TaxID=33897 RepID=UPI003318CEED
MASQATARRSRRGMRRMTAVVLTLGTVGALAGASPGAEHTQHTTRHGFVERDLVSDLPGRAEAIDPNLVNPWGLVRKPNGAILVSNNGSDTATAYSGALDNQPVNNTGLLVRFPTGAAPDGVVRNDTDTFRFSAGGKSGPARFLFSSESGSLFAFNPDVSPNAIQVAFEPSDGTNAVFKGLALVPGKKKDKEHDKKKDKKHEKPRILVTNFRDARVDSFDTNFKLLPPDRRFQDPSLPAGFAPFGIKTIGDKVFVTYALQDPAKHDDVAGPGNGFINVFSTEGKLLKRFASRGVLNSPWGLETAPKGFGQFAGDLLVGNFGDGRIHAFDLKTGRFEGTLKTPAGNPIVIPGLWGLQRGTDQSGGRHTVWFAAGIEDEAHGLLGTLRAAG